MSLRNSGISRESFVKGAGVAAAALGAGFPAFIPRLGEAAETIKIGQIDSLSGPYGGAGLNQVRGADMAVEAWNKRGGVMGRKIAKLVEDDQTNPGIGVQKARKLANEEHVAAFIGTVSSAVTLSVSGTAAAMNIPFVDAGGHTDDAVGKDCRWCTFMTCHTTWMMTHATGFSIAKLFGKRWYEVTPDYAFGHSIAAGYADVVQKVGGTIVANDLAPLGTTDFSPYLTKIEAAKPDVIIVTVSSQDYVNFMKQAGSFGLLKKFPVAGWAAELESVWALPPEYRVGYYGSEWYYNSDLVYSKKNTQAVEFAREWRKRYGFPATERSCFGYVAADRLLWAMNETKSTDAVKVARALEGSTFQSLWDGTPSYRKIDHSLIWPVWFGKLRPNGTPQDKFDVMEIVDMQEGEKVALSATDAGHVCRLNYPS
ncbi:ABC transporter substrate-binding protein [bacterium]|nr:MAG: ABC transporter substrate-binding protein [bacterium]